MRYIICFGLILIGFAFATPAISGMAATPKIPDGLYNGVLVGNNKDRQGQQLYGGRCSIEVQGSFVFFRFYHPTQPRLEQVSGWLQMTPPQEFDQSNSRYLYTHGASTEFGLQAAVALSPNGKVMYAYHYRMGTFVCRHR